MLINGWDFLNIYWHIASYLYVSQIKSPEPLQNFKLLSALEGDS